MISLLQSRTTELFPVHKSESDSFLTAHDYTNCDLPQRILHCLITFHVSHDMGRRSVFIAVGNLCENFTSDLKHLSHYVVVKYIVKKQLWM